MMMQSTQDVNVVSTVSLIPPRQLKAELPMSEDANRTVIEGRRVVRRIIEGQDPRLMAVVGPCSIHDPKAALEYAAKLHELSRRVQDRIFVVMRVYFEKPRTTLGWKGLINDPRLDGTFDIQGGLRLARQLLLKIAELGLPASTEMLEPITPQYIADLMTLASIGARTTESPTHRQMASGLSMPVGYKNGTDGSLQVAINALQAARNPHSFVGIDADGRTSIINTRGNPWGHVILRGGRSGTNFHAANLKKAVEQLSAAGLAPRLMVDCSHANSEKDHRKQANVWRNVIDQRAAGDKAVIGLMLESNILPGKQKLEDDPSQLEYGVSITDACLGWEETERLLLEAHETLQPAISAARV